MKKLIKNKKGYTLLVIIVILLVISLFLGLTLSISFVSRGKSLQFDTYRAQALYLAEAGVREVIWYLKYGQTQPPTSIEINFENWKGRAEMIYLPNNPAPGKTKIISEGKVPYNTSLEVKRVVEVIINSQTYEIENWEEKPLEFIQ